MSSLLPQNATDKDTENVNLTITVIAAILGTIAKKAVTGVGAPSYTSGVHI